MDYNTDKPKHNCEDCGRPIREHGRCTECAQAYGQEQADAGKYASACGY